MAPKIRHRGELTHYGLCRLRHLRPGGTPQEHVLVDRSGQLLGGEQPFFTDLVDWTERGGWSPPDEWSGPR